jgi:hypothetical protein
MHQVIKLAEESLARVLDFYCNVGTPLSYTPRIQYIDENCRRWPRALAMVREEVEFWRKYLEFFSQNLARIIWKEAYGIHLSDEAIHELLMIEKRRLGEIPEPEELGLEGDIIIFKPYRKFINASDEILAHEVWHLIEKERGVLQEQPFIIEGTATYAMIRFGKKKM